MSYNYTALCNATINIARNILDMRIQNFDMLGFADLVNKCTVHVHCLAHNQYDNTSTHVHVHVAFVIGVPYCAHMTTVKEENCAWILYGLYIHGGHWFIAQ